MGTVTCETCNSEFEDGSYCTTCDEFIPPEGTECEFCDNIATSYVQDHPVCEDCYEDSYPI